MVTNYVINLEYKANAMKKIILAGFLVVGLMACSDSSNKEVNAHDSVEMEEVEVFADKIMSVEVEGMVCEHACGGSIRKGLKETGAVARVEIDFEDDRDMDIAKVRYNSAAISEGKIISIIKGLNDGQFTVGETSVETITNEVKTNDETSESSEKSTLDAFTPSFEIPNLFDLLEGLIL